MFLLLRTIRVLLGARVRVYVETCRFRFDPSLGLWKIVRNQTAYTLETGFRGLAFAPKKAPKLTCNASGQVHRTVSFACSRNRTSC